MEYFLQKLAVKDGSAIDYPINPDLEELTCFTEKGYAFISEKISFEGLAESDLITFMPC